MERETRLKLNRLAREQMKHKLLNDISIDLQICEIEGYNKKEYIEELIQMLKSLIN
jgi:hypothetical protein